ncbi:hypothetical protein [Microcoleus sp. D3_18_C4]|uniref:hypothetical protein n=1 Tax=Microcoleus sp. D3_18_C4 TaxID=3055335 RepID=UPI002FCFE67F
MTDLLTITIRTIAPDRDSTLSKPEKGDRARLIFCEGDRLKPLNCKAFKLLVTPSAPNDPTFPTLRSDFSDLL